MTKPVRRATIERTTAGKFLAVVSFTDGLGDYKECDTLEQATAWFLEQAGQVVSDGSDDSDGQTD